MHVILKTVVSSIYEIPWLKMSFREAARYADRIILCEFDVTHTGAERPLIFGDFLEEFKKEFPNLEYYPVVTRIGFTGQSDRSADTHQNETLMRGWFARNVKVGARDVIFSVDADEVLYASTYEKALKKFTQFPLQFRLRQMFYSPYWEWSNCVFVGPGAFIFKRGDRDFPFDWRYQGKLRKGFHGVHFSWCLPLKAMENKLKTYSHAPEFSGFAVTKVLEAAIKDRSYPFDPLRPFDLKNIEDPGEVLPASFWQYEHLIAPEIRERV
jgi:hypothetical protein